MALLRDQEDLVALCRAAGEMQDLPAGVIEKDYWVTQALRALQEHHSGELIFKGGTSLSKAYKLIQRFSEDIDLLVHETGSLSRSQRYGRLKAMCSTVAVGVGGTATVLGTPNRDGLHRSVRVDYSPSLEPDGAMLGHIRLDIGLLGGVQPHGDRTIDTLLTQLLEQQRPDLDLGDFVDIRAFSLPVLHPGRTLIEKLILVHTCAIAAVDDVAVIAQQRIGRHFYDIHCLLGDDSVIELITGDEFDTVLADAMQISRQHFGATADRPSDGFAGSPAFDREDGVLRDALDAAYRRVMDDFYFGAVAYPSFNQIIERVQSHRSHL